MKTKNNCLVIIPQKADGKSNMQEIAEKTDFTFGELFKSLGVIRNRSTGYYCYEDRGSDITSVLLDPDVVPPTVRNKDEFEAFLGGIKKSFFHEDYGILTDRVLHVKSYMILWHSHDPLVKNKIEGYFLDLEKTHSDDDDFKKFLEKVEPIFLGKPNDFNAQIYRYTLGEETTPEIKNLINTKLKDLIEEKLELKAIASKNDISVEACEGLLKDLYLAPLLGKSISLFKELKHLVFSVYQSGGQCDFSKVKKFPDNFDEQLDLIQNILGSEFYLQPINDMKNKLEKMDYKGIDREAAALSCEILDRGLKVLLDKRDSPG